MSPNDPLDDYASDDGKKPVPSQEESLTPANGERSNTIDETKADPAGNPKGTKVPEAQEPETRRRTTFTAMREKTSAIRRDSPRKWTGLIIIGGIVVVLLVAIIAFAARDSGQAASVAPTVRPGYDTAPDIDKKFSNFMNSVTEDIPNQKKAIADTKKEVSSIKDQISAEMVAQAEARRSLEAKVESQLAEIRQLLKTQGQTPAMTVPVTKGDLDGFVQALKKQKGSSGLSLEEARLRLEAFLKQEGFAGRDLAFGHRDSALTGKSPTGDQGTRGLLARERR